MKIIFTGDVMLGRLVNEVLKHEPLEYPWGDTLDILRSADVRICNLECAITDVGQPWGNTPKAFHFLTDENNRLIQVKLYPTVIRNMGARKAKDSERVEVVAKMKYLCSEFDTKSSWREKEGFLEIHYEPLTHLYSSEYERDC